MRMLQKLIGCIAVLMLFAGCRKEKSLEEIKTPQEVLSQWEFKEGGVLFSGDVDTSIIESAAGMKTLSVLGHTTDGKGVFVLNIVGAEIEAGKSYSNPNVSFTYIVEGAVVYENAPIVNEDFTITIATLDSASVSGTFSGTVQDGLGSKLNIADGKFSSALGEDEDNEPDPDPLPGTLTVWAKEICSDGGSIQIALSDGQTGEIVDALLDPPSCGSTGTLTFTLPLGMYELTANCGTNEKKYTIIIDGSGDCIMQEVNFDPAPVFTNYLPLTIGSTWEYTDKNDPVNTNIVTVNGEDQLDGREYKRLGNTYGEDSYYRQQGNAYYQYVILDFGGVVSNAPTADIKVLDEDVSEGGSWETPEFDVQLGGTVPAKIKLVSTITRKGFAETYYGSTYQDLIEVTTELFASIDGGVTYQTTGVSTATIYGKGVGIVYYKDLGKDIEWEISGFSLNP